MQRTSFILALALLVVATTLAITITVRKPAPESAAAPTVRAPRPSGVQPPQRIPAASASAPAKSARQAEARQSFTVRAPEDHPQHALLAETAEQVESDARHQLARLSEQLELNREQRRRLFPILARASKHYDPALMISGLPAGSSALVGSAGNQAIDEVLDPPQRDQLMEDAIDEQILWQGIIDSLRQRLDEETPQIPDTTAPAAPESVPPSRGRGNLFDTLEPQD